MHSEQSISEISDRPLPPRNIVVSDIKADSCYLTWDAPEDNGGSEISNYIVERRDASKKKSDFDVLTINLIDRRYGVSSIFSVIFICSIQQLYGTQIRFLFINLL